MSIFSAEEIQFANFLSFGKTPTHLKFEHGINIITGSDIKTERSNASGKTALMDAIPFALFGRVSKSIKKENIVNWKNKKDCWVSFKFKKGNITYEVRRGIKPDFLEIYKDGSKIPPPPDKRMLQKTLEDEILGFDYYTFQSLFSINLNNYIPILKMSSIQKRQFLERTFGLENFSILNEKANKRVKKVEDLLYKQKIDNDSTYKIKYDLMKQNNALKEQINNVNKSSESLSTNVKKLEKLTSENPSIQDETVKLKSEHYELTINLSTLESDYENIRKEKINDMITVIDNDDKLLDNEIKKLNTSITKISNKVAVYKSDIKRLEDHLLQIEDKSICPTCGGTIDKKHSTDIKNKIKDTKLMLKENIVEYKKYDSELNTLKKSKSENNKKRKSISLGVIDSNEIDSIKKQINDNKKKIKNLEDKIKNNENIINQIKELTTMVFILKEQVDKEKETVDNIQKMIDENESKISELKTKYNNTNSQIKRLDDIFSYLSYIKTICKDDNIKQFAISAIMPYLTKKVNEHLGNIGSQFYVQFDNWLNETLEGPGIYKCSYGNLSGAESKSLDLSLQFAFLDVARLQAGIFPDILILDEILDSSLDSHGMNNILNLIKNKQIEDGLKVYIITHRKEIDSTGIEFDRVHNIIKKDGYSSLKI